MIYIKVSLVGEISGFLDTAENAKKIIDELIINAQNGDFEQSYEFRAVEMSEQDFDLLPEFQGF
jgi:hypothetical protein